MNFENLIVPLKWQESQAFVEKHHRHSKPLKRHKFSIGVKINGKDLNGIATIDNCSSSWAKRKDHFEIRRLCTDGTKNLGSFLLAKASQACFCMGAKVVITYTKINESCSTQLADNWQVCGLSKRPGAMPLIRWKKQPQSTKKLKSEIVFNDGGRMCGHEWEREYTQTMVSEIRKRYKANTLKM